MSAARAGVLKRGGGPTKFTGGRPGIARPPSRESSRVNRPSSRVGSVHPLQPTDRPLSREERRVLFNQHKRKESSTSRPSSRVGSVWHTDTEEKPAIQKGQTIGWQDTPDEPANGTCKVHPAETSIVREAETTNTLTRTLSFGEDIEKEIDSTETQSIKVDQGVYQQKATPLLLSSSDGCSLPVFHPHSWAIAVFDIVIAILISYTALVVPVELAWGLEFPALEVIGSCQDLIFFINIACNFNIAYSDGVEMYTDRRLIFRRCPRVVPECRVPPL